MFERLDLYTLELAEKILTLRDYKNDGVLSYVDTTKLEQLIDLTHIMLSKLKAARANKNQKVLQKISEYDYNQLVEVASNDFGNNRDIFSKCFYYLTGMNKELVHFTEDISLIPGKFTHYYITEGNHYIWPKDMPINIVDDDLGNTIPALREKIDDGENEDLDKYMDKLINVFYHYFDFGHQLMNDADSITYSFSLIAAVANGKEKNVYDFLKNVGILISSFIVFDRLNQLKKELDVYETKKQYYIYDAESNHNYSWLNEPRRSNILDVEKMLDNGVLEGDTRRFYGILDKHLEYLKSIQYLDVNLM